MEYEAYEIKSGVTFKQCISVAAISLAAIAALLTPFLIHADNLTPTLAFSAINDVHPACSANGNLVAFNQCAIWQAPHSLWPLTWLFAALLLLAGIVFSAYLIRVNHAMGKKLATVRLVSAVVTSGLGILAYAIMRGYSQNNVSHNFGLIAANLAEGSTLSSGGAYPNYVPIHQVALGFGLTPGMVTLLILAFVLPAFVSWHAFYFAKNYIGGQKLSKVFK